MKYVNALGTSSLEKYTIDLETANAWYVPLSGKAQKALGFDTDQKKGYIKIDKETNAMSHATDEELKLAKQAGT